MAHVYIGIVEDDASYRQSLTRLLRAAHYQPVAYASSEDFLADDGQPRFACLLLDIALGEGLSGIDLSRRLAESGSSTPFIFISAHDDVAMRAKAAEIGCSAFVSKIEPGGVLLQIIAGLLGRGPQTRPDVQS